MNPLSNYKNIFGEPRKGIHKHRFFESATIDYFLTLVVACITTHIYKIPLVLTTIFWLILGIIMHTIFGVETESTKWLNLVKY